MGVIARLILKPEPEQPDLISEIRSTLARLRSARLWFDSESDPDLIEACVYQIESLEASYRYLLRRAKQAGLRHDAFTGQVLNAAELEALAALESGDTRAS